MLASSILFHMNIYKTLVGFQCLQSNTLQDPGKKNKIMGSYNFCDGIKDIVTHHHFTKTVLNKPTWS
jgi:hypothetical protein